MPRMPSNTVSAQGAYITTHRVGVTSTLSLQSEVIEKIEEGTTVNVVEVIIQEDSSVVRGRIENPAGWISLWNLQPWCTERSVCIAGEADSFDAIILHRSEEGRRRNRP